MEIARIKNVVGNGLSSKFMLKRTLILNCSISHRFFNMILIFWFVNNLFFSFKVVVFVLKKSFLNFV